MFVVILLLVLWPVVEIAVFLQVAAWIGVLNTLGLMLAISLCGAWLVKRQGIGTLARMRAELDDGRIPTGPMTDGGLLAAAGFLLLVPPVRGGVRRILGRRFAVRTTRVRRAPGYLDVDEAHPKPPPPDRWDPPELLP